MSFFIRVPFTDTQENLAQSGLVESNYHSYIKIGHKIITHGNKVNFMLITQQLYLCGGLKFASTLKIFVVLMF